jgi:hypothetical protein
LEQISYLTVKQLNAFVEGWNLIGKGSSVDDVQKFNADFAGGRKRFVLGEGKVIEKPK